MSPFLETQLLPIPNCCFDLIMLILAMFTPALTVFNSCCNTCTPVTEINKLIVYMHGHVVVMGIRYYDIRDL